VPLLGGLLRLQLKTPQPTENHTAVVACKVLADGFIANPILLHAYFATIGVLEGRSPQEILTLTKEQFHQAWGLALVVWTPVQFLNFYFLPVHFQAAFVSAVNVGWKVST